MAASFLKKWLLWFVFCTHTMMIFAQNNPYCCSGYGGLFADSLGISAPEVREISANLYNPSGNTSLRLQIRRPVLQSPAACPLQKRPCIIVVHGGYWAELGAEDAWNAMSNEISRYSVPAGFITAGVRYRTGIGGGSELALLLGQPCWSNPVSEVYNAMGRGVADVQTATQYLFDNANALGIDTAQIYYLGFSSGAFNVIHAAYMRKGEQLHGTTLPGCPRVRGIIAVAGGTDNIARFDNADPKVPLLLLHGTDDKTAPIDCGSLSYCGNIPLCGSRAIYDRCQQLGIPAELHAACGSDHGLNGYAPDFIQCYLKKWIAERVAGKPTLSGVYYEAGATATAGGQTCVTPVCQPTKGVCTATTTAQSGLFSFVETGNAASGYTSGIKPAADGTGFLVAGTRGAAENSRAVVMRTDAQHNPLWTLRLDFALNGSGASTQATYGSDVVDLGNNQYVLLAAVNTGTLNWEISQNLDYVLVRFSYSTSGISIQWAKRFGGAFNDVPHTLMRTKDNGLLASGYSNMEQALNIPGKMRTFLVKTDLSGNMLWSKRYQDGSACNTAGYILVPGFNRRAVMETADGGFVFAMPCDERIYVTKTNAQGTVLWNRVFNAGGAIANAINLGGLGSVGLGVGSAGVALSLRELPNGDIAMMGNHVLILTGALYVSSNLQLAGATFPVGWVFTTNAQGEFKKGTAFCRQKSYNDPNQPVEMACQDFAVLPNGRFLVAAGLKGTLPALLEIDHAQSKITGGAILNETLSNQAVSLSDARGLNGLRMTFNAQTSQTALAWNLRQLLRYRGNDWSKATTCTTPADRLFAFSFKVDLVPAPVLTAENLPQNNIALQLRPLTIARAIQCGTVSLAASAEMPAAQDETYSDQNTTPAESAPQIQPNPVRGQLARLVVPSTQWLGASFEIFDAQGRLCNSGQVTDTQQELDLSRISVGLYAVRIYKEREAPLTIKGVLLQ